LFIGTSESCVDSGINSISLKQWYYVVGTWDGTSSKIYINGVLKNSAALTGTMSATANNVLIGSNPSNNRQFNGTIDEVRIWNRALSQTEIQSEMQSSMLLSRPIATWSFEESSGNQISDNHIRLSGKTGSAISFDGSNDYIRIKDNSSLDLTNAITLSAWIYPTSWPSTYPRIVSKEVTNTAAPYALELDNSGKRALLCLFIGTSESCVDSGVNSISLKQWYYVVGTWDGTSSKIYINGVLKNSAALTGTMSATANNITIGSNPSNNRQFAGIIDGVKIYNYALTGSDISTAYGLPAFTMPYVLGTIPELILSIISFALVIIEFIVVMMIVEKLRRPKKRKR
jgi:uncharacterized Zn-binding protein involved in type VI secretion